MKRSILGLLLIALLIFTACSSPANEPVTEAPVEQPDTAVAEEPTEEPAEEPAAPAETTEPSTETTSEPTLPDGPKVDGSKSKTLKFYENLFKSDEYTMRQYVAFSIGDVETKSSTTTSRMGDEYAVLTEWQSGEEEPSGFRIIIRDGVVYSVDDATKTFWKSDMSEEMNIPEQTAQVMEQIGGLEYVQGEAEVDGETYETETYVDQGLTMTYFFQGDDLKFLETRSENASARTYIDRAETKADPTLFEIPDDYEETEDSMGQPVG